MNRIDVIILAALVLAAAGSAVGVLTYEDDRLGTFDVSWASRTQGLELPSTSHTGAGAAEIALDVTRANLTGIRFAVAVASTTPLLQATDVLVEVVSPTNNTTMVETQLPLGPPGTIEVPVEVPLASVPDATRISGGTLDAARTALNATLSSSLGVGSWTVRVTFAPAAPGPLGGVEAHTIGGTGTLSYYEGELAVVGPEVGR